MEVKYTAFTKKGREKKENQDAILLNGKIFQKENWKGSGLASGKRACFAVSDGISSQPESGKVSLGLLQEIKLCREINEEKLKEINRRISQRWHAGATLTLLILEEGKFQIYHAGNSLLYRKWGGNFILMTPRQEIRGGLYNAFGIGEVEIFSLTLPLLKEEVFILASDGLTAAEEKLDLQEELFKMDFEDDASYIKLEIRRDE